MPHILIIDDSATVAYGMGKLLERQGFKVTVANDGQTGFDCALKDKPDVIVMDLIMPGMDGFQATRKFKSNEELKDIPVVIHSSKNMLLDRQWAEKQGAVGYVEKPATEHDVIEAIRPFLRKQAG